MYNDDKDPDQPAPPPNTPERWTFDAACQCDDTYGDYPWCPACYPDERRACGKCKRTIRPDEPAETAILGTVTDDAKHWTVEMLVCGDCNGGAA